MTFRVGDQRIGKVMFLRKGTTLFRSIEAATDDLGVERLVILVKVPEPGPLVGSPGCIGFGEKPQHQVLSAIVAKPNLASPRIRSAEIGGDIAWLQHRGFPNLDFRR